MIPNSIAFVNGKGGCGKTSVCANVAGLLANSGWKVCIVDLDHQANLARNFGYLDHKDNDMGAALLEALTIEDRTLRVPLRDVRPGLDIIPGGKTLRFLAAGLQGIQFDQLLLARELAHIAGDYDLILIDTPPAGGPMTSLALGAAEGVVIPVNLDYATLDGLEVVGPDFEQARQAGNVGLRLLGVVLFAMPSSGTRVKREFREVAEEALNGIAPVFENEIRLTAASGYHQRRDALVSFEYEGVATSEAKTRLQALRKGETTGGYSSAASGLAGDYAGLTEEIVKSLRNEGHVS